MTLLIFLLFSILWQRGCRIICLRTCTSTHVTVFYFRCLFRTTIIWNSTENSTFTLRANEVSESTSNSVCHLTTSVRTVLMDLFDLYCQFCYNTNYDILPLTCRVTWAPQPVVQINVRLHYPSPKWCAYILHFLPFPWFRYNGRIGLRPLLLTTLTSFISAFPRPFFPFFGEWCDSESLLDHTGTSLSSESKSVATSLLLPSLSELELPLEVPLYFFGTAAVITFALRTTAQLTYYCLWIMVP
jgi:hypothetical protein